MPDMQRENVQMYPRPPALEAVAQRIVIYLGGVVIVDTQSALRVLETHHAPTYYVPLNAIQATVLTAPGQSFCEWKGVARYVDVVCAQKTAKRAGWIYDSPTSAFAHLAGHVAFYASMMDACFVGAEKVLPQAGDFYGGWVTSNLDGAIKGARGSEHW